ncbi:MAG: diaminopimelate decarboxylase [Syntrophus sp. RIFOXYC2_FULL_54_9]|nr:MAG: diaminopimelate decarboxylase [Syntrophus sp. RIFOXYC2_FULL_54_9]
MNYFNYKDNELYCEEVSVEAIAREVGTPFYLYSARTLKRHFTAFTAAFAGIPHIICFAVKANSNIAILKSFANQGGGADIVSGGELYRALQAGIDPERIVYSGVGKRDDEIDFALRTGILMFNVESLQELEVINERAGKLGLRAGIAIRVNPDVNPQTHPHISTGLKENKFGIDVESSLLAYRQAAGLKQIDIKGVSCHIGSQITKILPFIDAIERLKTIIRTLRAEGIAIRYLDLGGGLGISYDQEEPPLPAEYARAVIEAAGDLGCTLIFEPGRVLVGNAGILVTRVLYKKENEAKKFFVVDAGMNDLIRPSLYGSFHKLQPVKLTEREVITADIVGPICESGDFLAKGRRVRVLERGELLAVMSAGAYGFTMSSNYNSRPRVPEIMVCDESWHVIRAREKNEDLIRGEKIPDCFI